MGIRNEIRRPCTPALNVSERQPHSFCTSVGGRCLNVTCEHRTEGRKWLLLSCGFHGFDANKKRWYQGHEQATIG